MHELSIANSLIEIVLERAGTERVQTIRLQIGALSCVHPDALRFSFDLVAADTPLAGATLHISELPIVIYCLRCEQLRVLSSVQDFRCPECQTSSGDIRQGQELDIESIEFFHSVPEVAAEATQTVKEQLQ